MVQAATQAEGEATATTEAEGHRTILKSSGKPEQFENSTGLTAQQDQESAKQSERQTKTAFPGGTAPGCKGAFHDVP